MKKLYDKDGQIYINRDDLVRAIFDSQFKRLYVDGLVKWLMQFK